MDQARARGIVFALLGLLAAGAVAYALGAGSVVRDFPIGVATGAVAVVATGWWLAGVVSERLASASLVQAIVVGAGVGVAALEVGVLLGSVPQLATEANFARWGLATELYSYIVKPLYWVNVLGLFPSAALGACFGVSVAGVAAGAGENGQEGE